MADNDLETYLLQLENVNSALSDVNFCGNREELNQLRDDLLELITMSQNIVGEDGTSDDTIEIDDEDDDSGSSSSEEFDVGSKCRAPFSGFSNSSINLPYHNALIFEVEPNQNCVPEEIKVKVMFCNPLTKSMQPCPYFLKGTCNFEETCRFSHGESVPFSQLTVYEEPDFENVSKDTLCLVKQDDNLWKLGRITAVSREEESAAVLILETNEEIQASFSSLLPIADKNKETGCSDGDDGQEIDNVDVTRKQIRHHAWRCDNLGGWEKHTKGVASKLMVKMGFIPGQGLGKDSDGRLEPIEAKILPKGKSLDKCLEKSSKDPLKIIKDKKRKQKLKERRRIQKGLEKDLPSTSNVFDIINDQLNSSSSKLEKPCRAEKLNESNDKDLNIKLLRLQENIRSEERNSHRYKNGVERNEKCDKFASARVKTKLNETDSRLQELKNREKILLNEIANRKNHKKFVQF